MHIISQKRLRDFWLLHPDAEFDLRRWYLFAKKSRWLTSADVKRVFSSASFVVGNRVIFNICGNKYQLVVKMMYDTQRIYIRFAGTHAQYDRIDAETV